MKISNLIKRRKEMLVKINRRRISLVYHLICTPHRGKTCQRNLKDQGQAVPTDHLAETKMHH